MRAKPHSNDVSLLKGRLDGKEGILYPIPALLDLDLGVAPRTNDGDAAPQLPDPLLDLIPFELAEQDVGGKLVLQHPDPLVNLGLHLSGTMAQGVVLLELQDGLLGTDL
eukprot:CAMPEP_0168624574 /NCGR_PEP_ID=MMETSP0449_2-20121227/9497_1 /TAXON_ID=1082188 /ORGANISM="Strombidium rassoulzadegani, Strain ras09" /LENGTH=108 /DNA_ID=CAMNT_0008666163 /DNA_START=295 /DNA_END=617 /DNA_ORIENTATION=+